MIPWVEWQIFVAMSKDQCAEADVLKPIELIPKLRETRNAWRGFTGCYDVTIGDFVAAAEFLCIFKQSMFLNKPMVRLQRSAS